MVIKQSQPPKDSEAVKVPVDQFHVVEMVDRLVKPHKLKVMAYRGVEGYWLAIKKAG